MITIIETPISGLSAEKSQVFLDYFLSKLCAKHNSILHAPNSAGIIQQNKWYITIEDYLLDKEGKKIKIEWKIIQEHDKTISLVQVLAHLDNSDDHTRNQANEFLTETLLAVVSGRKSKYFHRF